MAIVCTKCGGNEAPINLGTCECLYCETWRLEGELAEMTKDRDRQRARGDGMVRDIDAACDAEDARVDEVKAELAIARVEITRLREGVECHVARPGEGTYECRHESPCPACQMRHLRTDLAAEKERAERAEHKYADAHAVYRKTRLHMGEELRTLAAAVKTSGVVCPVCGGGQLPPLESRCRCGGLYDIVAVIGTGEVKHIWRCRNCNTVAPKNVCPRCSVEMGEVVKCWECRGTRTVREWDRSTGYSENVSCSYCHGLGKHISIRGDGTVYLRTVALGLVYDEGVIGGGVTQQVTGRHTEESLVTVDDTTGNQPTKEDRRKMEGFWDKAKGQLGQ